LSAVGGALSIVRRATLGLWLALSLSGCMQQAVLENDVRSAQWKARTLSTATDLNIAEAALSAQLVELEALYQRAPEDARLLGLLDRGYQLMARGFIELRHLDAVNAGDTARAEQELRLRTDAEARARYYRQRLGSSAPSAPSRLESDLVEAEAACARHDRATYEQNLNALLAEPESAPEARLERALLKKLAGAWLMPNAAVRCKF
jgi:hypothetical protein